ncbi:DUF4388 domain-containing protein [candidate division GN15 bacterium]|nr:DUF4388 domain-containing protein [candidate division GN15 bacterium]
MTNGKQRPRLDEILTNQQQLSDEQIRIALKHQKTFGGKFGSHLLHHGFVGEKELVSALEKQLDCEGVQLSGLEIPVEVIEMVPSSVAFTRKIMPFAYHAGTQTLKVACEDPSDQSLIDELHSLLPDLTIKLCVAVELSLNLAISRYYGSREGGDGEEVPETGVALPRETSRPVATRAARPAEAGTVLLVTADGSYASVLKLLLERSAWHVAISETVEHAQRLLAEGAYALVLVHETGAGEGAEMLHALGKLQQTPRIRCFSAIADLILENDTALYPTDPLHHDLELFTSLLTIKDRQPSSYSAKTTHYCERLAHRLNFSETMRRSVTEACHLLDRAKLYNMASGPRSLRRLLGLATKLLQSVYYKPEAIEILRSMYVDLAMQPTTEVPEPMVGGNILTIVDMFHEQVVPNQRLSLERFEQIRVTLEKRVGKLLLPDVYREFVNLIREEVLNSPMFTRLGQIMIYTDDHTVSEPLEQRLKAENFRTIRSDALEPFLQLYRRGLPDILLLTMQAHPREIISKVNEMIRMGVNFKDVPTFLIVRHSAMAHLTSLLEEGIEDIIPCDGSIDIVVLKVQKTWGQHEHQARPVEDEDGAPMQSRGSLSDMSLIDLLQALGPSRKTTRITVTPGNKDKDRLTICLDQGNIVWAKLGDVEGADAIYIGMTWDEGSWSVEPLAEKDLAQPNNFLSNEAILMEGCRRKDEIARQIY